MGYAGGPALRGNVGVSTRATVVVTVTARVAGVSMAVVWFTISVTAACIMVAIGWWTSVTGRALAGHVAVATFTVPGAAVVVVAAVPDHDAAVSVGKAADAVVVVLAAVSDRSLVSVGA